MNKLNFGTVWILLFISLTWPLSAAYAVNPEYKIPEELRVGVMDLPHIRVGSLKGSQQINYLARAGVEALAYESIAEGLKAVSEKKLDAFVHDAAILKYIVKKAYFEHLHVLPDIFNRHYVSMILPEGSRLREPVNRALLTVTEKNQWKDLLQSYLGPTF